MSTGELTPIQLEIGGMTCASCAARIERRLNKLDGVTASVNYATEKATVVVDGAMTRWCRRSSSTGGSGWSLTLAAPVVVWGGLPFHRAAWTNLRHGAATMDTLISVGTSRGVRVVAVRAVPRRRRRAGHDARLLVRPERGMGSSQIYLEVAAGVTMFILAGRYFEARAKRRPGRRCGRCSSSGPRTSPSPRRRRGAHPGRELAVGDGSSSGRARRSPPTASVEEGTSAPSTRRCSPARACRSRSARRRGHRRHGERRRPPRRARHPGRHPTPARPDGPLVEQAQSGKAPCSAWPTGSRRCSSRS
jgi:P-type Cu+ transporter